MASKNKTPRKRSSVLWIPKLESERALNPFASVVRDAPESGSGDVCPSIDFFEDGGARADIERPRAPGSLPPPRKRKASPRRGAPGRKPRRTAATGKR